MSAPQITQALLPCPNPWCEGPEREGDFSPVPFRRQFGTWLVGCTSCSMDGPIASTEAEAIAAWNTRHREASQAELVEALRGLLNFAENTEGELGIELDSASKARALLAKIGGAS